MLPSVGFLSSIVAGLVAKLGLAQLAKHGYMPQSTYVKAALKALEEDDLDEAVRNYQLAIAKKRSSNRTEITYEIIASAIALRVSKLEHRTQEINKILHPSFFSSQWWRNRLPRHRLELESLREEQIGCQEAIAVLARLKEQLEH